MCSTGHESNVIEIFSYLNRFLDDSEDEPIRIIRGTAGPIDRGNYDEYDHDQPSFRTPTKPIGKPKKSPKDKPMNERDRRIRMKEEAIQLKMESARLLRETNVKLPRNENVLTLDEIQEEEIKKEEEKKTPEFKLKKRERLLKLVNNQQPTLGKGFIEMNPSLKKLQDKVNEHTKPVKRKETKIIKTLEHVRNEQGEIIDVKEVIIERPKTEHEVKTAILYIVILAHLETAFCSYRQRSKISESEKTITGYTSRKTSRTI